MRLRKTVVLVAVMAGVSGLAGCAPKQTGLKELALKTTIDAKTMLDIAERLRAAGEVSSAMRLYRQILASEPKNAGALFGLGTAFYEVGDYAGAAKLLRASLEAEPENIAARRVLAKALINANQPGEALAELELWRQKQPDNPQIYNAMGIAFDLLDQHGEALVRYSQGLALAPKDPRLRNNLALSMALGGEFDAAIALMREAAADPGAAPQIRQNLALIYGLAGKTELARKTSRMDLDEAATQNNLHYFAALRRLGSRERAAAVLLGKPLAKTAAPPEQVQSEQKSEPPAPQPAPEPVAKPASPASAAPAPALPYIVRLASYNRLERALTGWRELQRQAGGLLDDAEPLVRKGEAGPGGRQRYRLEVKQRFSRADAQAFCRTLKEKGLSCLVVKLAP